MNEAHFASIIAVVLKLRICLMKVVAKCLHFVTTCLHFVMSSVKQNKKRKQTRECAVWTGNHFKAYFTKLVAKGKALVRKHEILMNG